MRGHFFGNGSGREDRQRDDRNRSAASRLRLRGRRGAALVEFAVVAPLFFLLIIGIIEFGRVVMVQQILTNASREGARRAILEGATASDVQTLVGDYLTNASISGGQVSVSPSSLESLGFGNPVTVSVSVPYAQVTWVPASGVFESLHGATLSARTVMRAERPE